jgi:predicted HAD superfamily Cof-like phosphohydrolase
MKKYLYCIQYGVTDQNLKFPETLHMWFNEHPDDGKIREVIDTREKPFPNSQPSSNFHYFMVHDITRLVPFVDEVEKFNRTFGKPNNYKPNIPKREEWEFVYNFVLEELEEYKEACENGDIVGVLDALCDITYVSLGNGAMLHGLKHKIVDAYSEIQASNMSKSCKTEEEAIQTVELRSQQQEEPCHYEEKDDYYVVYRTRDRKVMKSINYFKPNLTQFFSSTEIEDCMSNSNPDTII